MNGSYECLPVVPKGPLYQLYIQNAGMIKCYKRHNKITIHKRIPDVFRLAKGLYWRVMKWNDTVDGNRSSACI